MHAELPISMELQAIKNLKQIAREEYIVPGTAICGGCGRDGHFCAQGSSGRRCDAHLHPSSTPPGRALPARPRALSTSLRTDA